MVESKYRQQFLEGAEATLAYLSSQHKDSKGFQKALKVVENIKSKSGAVLGISLDENGFKDLVMLRDYLHGTPEFDFINKLVNPNSNDFDVQQAAKDLISGKHEQYKIPVDVLRFAARLENFIELRPSYQAALDTGNAVRQAISSEHHETSGSVVSRILSQVWQEGQPRPPVRHATPATDSISQDLRPQTALALR